jgi:Tfp pilus assembly protein PilZ
MASRDERRRSPRVPLSPSFAESDPRTTTPVRDLSQTGVMVATNQLYPIGTRIELRFVVFPEAPELFIHTGRVTRHSHDPPGMGVEFDPPSEELRGLIDRIIAYAEQSSRKRGRRRVTFDAQGLQARRLGAR